MNQETIARRGMTNHITITQLGAMNHIAISGGRTVIVNDHTIELPVSHGYYVRVQYIQATDTYTVSRIFRRGLKEWNKGTLTGIYYDQLPDTAWTASCYENRTFGD